MRAARKQCGKCPWRTDVDPRDIPHGYCEALHERLAGTIAPPGAVPVGSFQLRVMACHESPVGREIPCVGWLVHQHGPGNNIGLRLAVASGRISMNVETVGEQHRTFEDTLPPARTGRPAGSSNPRYVRTGRHGGGAR